MEGRKKKIIIVGAGIAGVGAARWLIDNDIHQSLEIVVLEARDRVGGRVYTNFDFDCPIDLGASWLHNHCPENPVSIMANHLNLNIKKSDEESGEVYDLTGKQYGDLHTARTWELMEKMLAKSVKSLQANDEEQSLEDVIFRKVSPQQWEDPVFQSWFAILDFELGCPISKVSPAAICQDWKNAMDGDEEDNDMVFRDTGYIGIINALLTGRATDNPYMQPRVPSELVESGVNIPHLIPMNVLLNHCVESIDIVPSNQFPVRVSVSVRNLSNDEGGGQRIFEADCVIVTVPLGVLKSNLIQFHPPLSQPKQVAIQRAGFGNVVKIVLEFEKIFWSAQTEFLAIADHPLCSPHPSVATSSESQTHQPQLRGLCTHFWNLFPYHGKKILVCFGLGDAASIIDKMTDEELMELLLSRLKCLEKHSKLKMKFKDSSPSNYSEEFYQRYRPTRWMRTHWGDDPYTLGSYSYPSKGLSIEASQSIWMELNQPENEYLWFAGEATMTSSLTRACVHGAWLSGIRTAENVAKSLSQPIYSPGFTSFPFPPSPFRTSHSSRTSHPSKSSSSSSHHHHRNK